MGEGFANPVVNFGGDLVRAAIRSPNYVAGVSGWTINKDGSVEFSDGTFRGTVDASVISGGTIEMGGGVGHARMVRTQAPTLPAPLNTYVFAGSGTALAADIYYAEGDDTRYTFDAVVSDPFNATVQRVWGAVYGGSVHEYQAGVPFGLNFIVDPASAAPVNFNLYGHAAGLVAATGDVTVRADVGDANVFAVTGKVRLQGAAGTSLEDTLYRDYTKQARVITDSGQLDSSAGIDPLTTTQTDISGCSITVTTVEPNAKVRVTGTFDMYMKASDGNIGIGYLSVDGAVQTRTTIFKGVTNTVRMTVSMTWNVALAAAGNHTIKLRANSTNNTSVGLLFATMTYDVME